MVKTTVVAEFPPGYFLENIVATHAGGLFVTCANREELYYIHVSGNGHGTPMLVHKFERHQWAMGIIEAPHNPNVLFMVTSDALGLGSRTSHLYTIDVSNAGTGCTPQPILTFPLAAKGLNGLCALSKNVLIVADSFQSCSWRIDVNMKQSPPAQARFWLSDPTMAGELRLPDFQPGANGLKYSAVTGRVYYTSTQQRLFCQVGVHEQTLEPEGDVEVVAEGMQGDDLIVDDQSTSEPVAYVTTHRDNTVLGIPLDPRHQKRNTTEVSIVAKASEQDDTMLGPTAGSWVPSRAGKCAYFTTDGGLKNIPSDGLVRCATVVRMDF